MVYQKYSNRRGYMGNRNRRYGTRVVVPRKPPTRWDIYGGALKKLASDVNKVRGMINVEYKYHDFSFTDNSVTTSPVTATVNLVSEGDTDQTHDGAMFRMKSLQIEGSVQLGSASPPHIARMVLVLDTDSSAVSAAPTYNDVYDATGTITNRLRNLDNRSRFIILKEWNWFLQPNGTEGKRFSYYRELDHKVQIVGTASQTNLKKNGLYLMYVSDSSAANNIVLDVTSRIRYIDN